MVHALWLCLALLCARSAHGGSDAASLQVRRNVCFKRAPCNVGAGHPLQLRDFEFGRADNATKMHNGLTVVLNGKVVLHEAQLPGVNPIGKLGLQNHGNPLEFANFYVKEL